MNICWFSAGVSSFIAAYLVRNELDKVIYCHIDDQHTDTMRFVKDCEKALGITIEILQSEYKNVDNVLTRHNYVCQRGAALCTDKLKRAVRKRWEYDNLSTRPTYIWGYDCTERNRVDKIVKYNPNQNHRFPLIEKSLTKESAHALISDLGIKRPAMYDMGYRNNNCIGCIKGGMGYWNKIRLDFPEVFALRAKREREIGASCINGVFLDELDPNRGRIEDDIDSECSIYCQIARTYL
jgi:3'-phosphoadenosine 5'-phosphosulfate sulfotransferase (PAPS reductase)/FAD synthetase